jgi:FSR family fosmidomycin resistance protein-like MFS transporter
MLDNRPATDRSIGLRDALLLGLAHALVDAASGYLLFRDLAGYSRDAANGLVILYNVLAFAGQVPGGAIADRLRAWRPMAASGVALAAVALLAAPSLPAGGVVLVGIGNALCHVGAGAHVLRHSGRRSADGGVFVGPGAVGLFAGIWLATHGVDCRALLVALVTAAVPLVVLVLGRDAEGVPGCEAPAAGDRDAWLGSLALAAAGLLGSVVVRSFAGGAVGGAWRAVDPGLLPWLAVAAFAGKAAGGLVADRVGWASSSAVALAAAACLLGLLPAGPVAAVLGMLLLQSTMPVTLKATHLLVPRRPGLAFGLPCLALLAGALLGIVPAPVLRSPFALAVALLLSAGLVVGSLHLLARVRPASSPWARQAVPALRPGAQALHE